MSNDDLEKKMEFIVEQQANFSARMEQLEELVARFAKATADRFQLTDKRADETDERISALVNAHIQTEESLRNLIAVVDRYFSAGRNGQAET